MTKMSRQENDNMLAEGFAQSSDRRRILRNLAALAGVASIALPAQWSRPIANSVLLPAHAQTSVCVVDSTVGGPLIGNPSGAGTCQTACADLAAADGANLCLVTESVDGTGATICDCALDLP